jgi:chemotaxis protein CheD
MTPCRLLEPLDPSGSSCSPRSADTDADGRRRVFLHPGHTDVGLNPTAISCILGSCVEVCLWDSKLKIGGAIHYLLPGEPDVPSRNSGVQGIRDLISRMSHAGANPRRLVGKIFGGACVLMALRSNHIGMRNIAAARSCLSTQRIAIVEEDVGGDQGRKVIFLTDTGETRTRLIGK